MNKRIFEYWDDHKINGEYWILDGDIQFADGDVGDYNHEGIAIQAIFSKFSDEIMDLADECEIDVEQRSFGGYDECDAETLSDTITNIRYYLEDEKQIANSDAYIQQAIGADDDAYSILCGRGDAREYYMKYFGAIAVRGNNVELYGYSQDRTREMVYGIEKILSDSGFDDSIPDEEIELAIYDHKTRRSFDMTLADLRNPPSARPQQLPDTKGHSKFHVHVPDSAENYFRGGTPKQPTQKAVPGQDTWRGTSEGFKHWFNVVVEGKKTPS